jgi:uncharacterized protein
MIARTFAGMALWGHHAVPPLNGRAAQGEHQMGRSPDRGTEMRRVAAALLVTLALLCAACTQDIPGFGMDRDLDGAAPAAFEVRGSVNQVVVTGAEPGTELELVDADGMLVRTGTADDRGALIMRQVPRGDGYRVATAPAAGDEGLPADGEGTASEGPEVQASEAFTVTDESTSTPSPSFYAEQDLGPGFQYITTRDGTTLAASIYLPGPPEEGPYPTVVEYSGYNPAKPGTNLLENNREALQEMLGVDPLTLCPLLPFACEAPAQPASLLARALGYAVVGVNMRGTGCSGGAYDYFEPLQVLDGYDVVETVAAQPWVKGNKVGMVGLSYPGISQLFVAAAQPPSLAAITPLSVFDDTVRGVLAPGGIFNEGFALQWASNVLDEAEPFGQGWEQALVDDGDTTCAENQQLRGQNVDVVAKAKSYRYYESDVADPLNPAEFADRIEVPVFLTGAYQDEQTGGRFPLLFDRFERAPVARFSAWNGAHADGFAPFNLTEWKTFLDLYVGGELTPLPPAVAAFAPVIMQQIFDAEVSLPPQRFLDRPDIAAARAAYEAEAPIRLVFESGAGDPAQPGAPVPTAEVRVSSWPPPGTVPTPWYLHADGTLASDAPEDGSDSASRFLVDPALAETTTFTDGPGKDLFHADPGFEWRQEPAGAATVFVTPPLTRDVVLAGSASADLWLRSSTPEADVGVTLSEVRPDGNETFVQAGVLRTSMRKVAAGSTELLPLRTNLQSDAAPMPVGEFTEARVEILPFAHIVRAGSRLRLSVHTPGGDRPRWTYILDPQPRGATMDVGHSARHPSRLVLPVTDGLGLRYPAQLPPCPGLRGQPCRTHVPYTNTPAPDGDR